MPGTPHANPAGTDPLFIGLMSGTSTDGVDGVIARFRGQGGTGARLQTLAHVFAPMPEELRQTLLALNLAGHNELHMGTLAANALARLQASVVHQLLDQTGCMPREITAVGSHGQTVRHRPAEFDGTGYTCQLNNGALLAELCGIDVVCDFRSRDVAAGGQGAPLVPACHAELFALADAPRAVLNLGGIGNLSVLPARNDAAGRVTGFDCGPANALMDHWCQQHLGQPFDRGGAWAASGTVNAALLEQLLSEPFLAQRPPKSTGRDLFNVAWLTRQLASHGDVAPVDVQATLTEFTARAACDALTQHSLPGTRDLLVCGGGALNDHLMRRLAALLPGWRVAATDSAGVPAMQVEAVAFAWLARAFCQRDAGNRAEVTGARGPRVLGALYPA
ncbi:anhydro-N-acetylmuramic acid kinase [Ideonella margarita]|uniref:Anhydro-N-acetylmuramic acid kinase n=1 Tax=Ideonella margarita TaxID=2984191 RepID=A0ABU9BZ23_9BURK